MAVTPAELPVLLCDAFWVQPVSSKSKGDNLRLSLGHNLNSATFFHTSVSLNTDCVKQLSKILLDYLAAEQQSTPGKRQERINKRANKL